MPRTAGSHQVRQDPTFNMRSHRNQAMAQPGRTGLMLGMAPVAPFAVAIQACTVYRVSNLIDCGKEQGRAAKHKP